MLWFDKFGYHPGNDAYYQDNGQRNEVLSDKKNIHAVPPHGKYLEKVMKKHSKPQ